MKELLMSHLYTAFVALGGLSALVGYVLKNDKVLIHEVDERALRNPKLKDWLMKYRPQIEKFFDDADAQLKADLDQAQQAQPKQGDKPNA